jgi:hypothetical protein
MTISDHQSQSGAISEHQSQLMVISGHQWPSVTISRNQWSSVAIKDTQPSSRSDQLESSVSAITCTTMRDTISMQSVCNQLERSVSNSAAAQT